MVYFLCHSPALCILLDALAAAAGGEAARAEVAAFVRHRLEALTEALPPSLLLDALFAFATVRRAALVYAQQQQRGRLEGGGKDAGGQDYRRRVVDALCRAGAPVAAGESSDAADAELDVYVPLLCGAHCNTAAAADLAAALVRLRAGPPAPGAGPGEAEAAGWPAAAVASLSVLDLTLDALRAAANAAGPAARRRQTGLLQPSSLALLVPDLTALWSLVALAAAAAAHRQRQADLVFGRPDSPPQPQAAGARAYHDYALLLPADWLRARLTAAGGLTVGAALALCRRCCAEVPPAAPDCGFAGHLRRSFLSGVPAAAAATAAAPVVAAQVIVCPAVSEPRADGAAARRVKNRRVDAIDHLALQHGFRALAAGGTPGAAGGRLDLRAGGGGSLDREKSHSAFVRDVFINFDIHVMALSGGIMGYGLGWLRGAPPERCLLYGVVLYFVLFVADVGLLFARVSREDLALAKRRRGRERALSGLARDPEEEEQEVQAAAASSTGSARRADTPAREAAAAADLEAKTK